MSDKAKGYSESELDELRECYALRDWKTDADEPRLLVTIDALRAELEQAQYLSAQHEGRYNVTRSKYHEAILHNSAYEKTAREAEKALGEAKTVAKVDGALTRALIENTGLLEKALAEAIKDRDEAHVQFLSTAPEIACLQEELSEANGLLGSCKPYLEGFITPPDGDDAGGLYADIESHLAKHKGGGD